MILIRALSDEWKWRRSRSLAGSLLSHCCSPDPHPPHTGHIYAERVCLPAAEKEPSVCVLCAAEPGAGGRFGKRDPGAGIYTKEFCACAKSVCIRPQVVAAGKNVGNLVQVGCGAVTLHWLLLAAAEFVCDGEEQDAISWSKAFAK